MVDGLPQVPSVVVRLAIDPGEPMAGTMVIENTGAEQVPFCGWIELMSAITTARTAPSNASKDHRFP